MKLSNFIKRVYLDDFKKLPSGFNKEGFIGYFVGKVLFKIINKLGKKVEFHILREDKTYLKHLVTKVKIFLGYNELSSIAKQLRLFNRSKNKSSNDLIQSYLYSYFPRYFKESEIKYDSSYKEDQLSGILKKKSVLKNLSKSDVEELADFYPRFWESNRLKLSRIKRLIITKQTKNREESVYLNDIIKEFEQKLNAQTQDEHKWQEFLRDYILLFNTNYVGVLPKKNISLKGDYPDFLLINVYGYLDIYEIKRPNTPLLSLDKSRNNYYWTPEIAKAISQVENYIEEIQENKNVLINNVRDKTGVNIRVIKPRGYIIAGTNSQLIGSEKRDDFQMLNGSLKNIEIILYDDFLNNLKNLLKRLRGDRITDETKTIN